MGLQRTQAEHAGRLRAARKLRAVATAPPLTLRIGRLHPPLPPSPRPPVWVLYAPVESALCGCGGPSGGGVVLTSHPDAPQPPMSPRVVGEAVWPGRRRAARRLSPRRAGAGRGGGGGAAWVTLPNTTRTPPRSTTQGRSSPMAGVDRRPRRRCAHLLHVRVRGWGGEGVPTAVRRPPAAVGALAFLFVFSGSGYTTPPVAAPTWSAPSGCPTPPVALSPPSGAWTGRGRVFVGTVRGELGWRRRHTGPLFCRRSPSRRLVSFGGPRHVQTTRGVCSGWLAATSTLVVATVLAVAAHCVSLRPRHGGDSPSW